MPINVTLPDVYATRQRITPYVRRTPFIASDWLSRATGRGQSSSGAVPGDPHQETTPQRREREPHQGSEIGERDPA